ncbi:MAG: YfhO family protein [Prevotella sp.]|uniref:YfhO family protein n=1 Tax=Prevotella sp. PTAC TaxID=2736295 RepID=UPI0015557340|nr:YfhO family protein [Prevotella sp. PTAC]MCX4292483.1 YfhO family protein [Prevotella sp.]NPD53682.1 YfhO family protein [Prevotella sp. PTAC]
MNTFKKCLPDLLAVLLFAVLAFAYFFPADTEGRILYRHDSSAGRGLGQEQVDYRKRTGEMTRWTNSAFCGMPTYQIAPSYDSSDVIKAAEKAYHLWLPENVWYVFAYMLGFYILLRAFDFRQSLAALGSIIWAFSSYFFIIIAAGHIWKVMALAYLPPMIAGIVLAYRGRYLWGLLVTSLFCALEINANHVQMTYYYLFIIVFMVIAYAVEAVRSKEYKHFAKATAVCAMGALIGLSINISNLYHTWEYSKESMRGKSELTKADSANQTDSGLERDYITQWSYGVGETWTLLVPNTKGGASVPMARNKTAMKHADPNYSYIYQQIGQYWGEQPGTSGPVYVGAFVLMLFVLGLFIVKGPLKWALLSATVLSVLLSWGHNFMPFTDFFIDYVPMYSKFRTVASILVIAEFTIPLLAMLALKRIVDEPELLTAKIKYVYLSFALTGGVALLFALMPSIFFSNYVSSSELSALSQFPQEQLQPLLANLTEMRKAMFTADCWRSFAIIVAGTLLLLLYKAKRLKSQYMIAGIVVLCLADMWQVNKRYLNDEMFVERSVRETPVTANAAVTQVMNDKSLYYRVLNLASNTFNENETSYHLKSVGGYHPAKLRRYQEMVERYISPEMQALFGAVADAQGDMTKVDGDSIFPVLSMVNTKYFIFPLQSGQAAPLLNPYAFGNGWFVDRVEYVDDANREIAAVGDIDLRRVAVADTKFKEAIGESVAQDSTGTVTLTSYDANRLTYDISSSRGGVVVFSDIYYPGWTATVDGVEVPVGRVNYILRAINVKPGAHKVELSFFPKTVDTTETIAYAGYVLLVIIVVLLVLMEYRKRRK